MKLMTVFNAGQFTPTKWDSAETKAKFANQFVTFVQKGFPQYLFTKDFYKRLSNTFGHIAHYNQGGFWDEFFESTNGKAAFIDQTLQWPCYGDPTCTYSDVEKALQKWCKEQGVQFQVHAAHENAVESAERAELARLQSKYPA